MLGGNGQDLVMNRFADAGTILGYGIGSLGEVDILGRMTGLALTVVLGISDAGCCFFGGNFVDWDWGPFSWLGPWGIRSLQSSCTGYIVKS